MSNASRGRERETERIEYYKAQGWRLLDHPPRRAHPDAERGINNDVGGAWDFWMVRDEADGSRRWLFVQVGEHNHKAEKITQALAWMQENGLVDVIRRTERKYIEQILYHVDTYCLPHWEGGSKSKVYHDKTEWESVSL